MIAMSRIPLAIAMRKYLTRREREFCGEVTTRFDFMIRKHRNVSYQDKFMNAISGGSPIVYKADAMFKPSGGVYRNRDVIAY
jgi:hypothetical protein